MTAHALKGDRDRCLAAGMDGYVAKPIQPHELCRTLDGLLPRGNEVLDRQTVLQSVGGDGNLLREIIEMFATQAPLWMADIRSAVVREDAAHLRRVAHTLKGAVGHFGIGTVYDEAQHLETMGHDGNLAGTADACEKLDQQLQRLLEGLAAFSR